jgi:hypothetical protein
VSGNGQGVSSGMSMEPDDDVGGDFVMEGSYVFGAVGDIVPVSPDPALVEAAEAERPVVTEALRIKDPWKDTDESLPPIPAEDTAS